jgi:hypothetical protein
MDPFIEGQRWQDFHATLITIVREMLMPQVRPRYVVEVAKALNYQRAVEPPLAPAVAEWVQTILRL